MAVHLVSDNIAKLSKLRGMLEKRYKLKSELLSHADLRGKEIEAVVVAADLRDVNNITAIKEISPKLARIPKRIFLIDRKSRLSTVQAYALGATSVLSNTVNRTQLLAKLADPRAPTVAPSITVAGGRDAAFAGAACIASMFTSVLSGEPIDVDGARNAGAKLPKPSPRTDCRTGSRPFAVTMKAPISTACWSPASPSISGSVSA